MQACGTVYNSGTVSFNKLAELQKKRLLLKRTQNNRKTAETDWYKRKNKLWQVRFFLFFCSTGASGNTLLR